MAKYCIILFFITSSLIAQPTLQWEKNYGGLNDDIGYSIKQTNDGGFIVVGTTRLSGVGQNNVYLIKTDSNGDTSWTKNFGGINDDEGYSVEQTSDGYIITGYTRSFSAGGSDDVYLIKADSIGNINWTKSFGGFQLDRGVSVKQTSEGNYIIVGQTYSLGAGQSDIYAIKTNMSGDTLWTKTYGGLNNELGSSVQQTPDNGYIFTGITSSYGSGGFDIYLVKTDSTGNILWTKTYGGTSDDFGNSIILTNDGGYIIVGTTISFSVGGRDIYLIKTNLSGDTLWTRTYGGIGDDEGISISQTMDSSYIIAGFTSSFGTGNSDMYILKIDLNGDTIWTKTFGGDNNEECYSICSTSDGGYAATGFSSSFGVGDKNLYIIKIIDNYIPVELISFEADFLNNVVTLNWITGTETNNSGFEIEQKLINESNWNRLCFINGFGTTTKLQQYSYQDKIKTSGTYLYRLKQIDFDGTYKYSNEINICVDILPNEYMLYQNYPNPFNPSTKINYSLKTDGRVSLKIYNTLGEEVITLMDEIKPAGSYEAEFNESNLPSGIYIYRMQSGEYVSSKKMLLIK